MRWQYERVPQQLGEMVFQLATEAGTGTKWGPAADWEYVAK